MRCNPESFRGCYGTARRYAHGTSLHIWIDSLSSDSVDGCWYACHEAERQKFEMFHKVLRQLNITNASLLQAFRLGQTQSATPSITRSFAADAVIRVYHEAGDVIETHEHRAGSRSRERYSRETEKVTDFPATVNTPSLSNYHFGSPVCIENGVMRIVEQNHDGSFFTVPECMQHNCGRRSALPGPPLSSCLIFS